MAYSETLADRIRELIAPRSDWEERKMFGGLCFMVRGHMACGIVGEELMLRAGDRAELLLTKPHARPMDFTGRPMRGMLYVGVKGIRTRAQLQRWIEEALDFSLSLPPRRGKKKKAAKKKTAAKSASRSR